MPYLDTAQQWLEQSTLLLKARPSTTRITTKYTISPPSSKTKTKTKTKTEPNASTRIKTEPDSTTTQTTPAPATLTLKTYDPASGVTLKYNTNKAAEVSRLIQILGRLARPMAGLPEIKEEGVIKTEEVDGSGPGTPALESVPSIVGGGKVGGGGQQGGAQGGGQAGKKGKKKGKK